jgi:hypothetical protein
MLVVIDHLPLLTRSNHIVVHEDPTTVFAHDHFLVTADVQLTLGRNAVEAATAATAFNGDHTKSVAGIGTDPVIGAQ